MLTDTSRWSHARGNKVVPSRWQAANRTCFSGRRAVSTCQLRPRRSWRPTVDCWRLSVTPSRAGWTTGLPPSGPAPTRSASACTRGSSACSSARSPSASKTCSTYSGAAATNSANSGYVATWPISPRRHVRQSRPAVPSVAPRWIRYPESRPPAGSLAQSARAIVTGDDGVRGHGQQASTGDASAALPRVRVAPAETTGDRQVWTKEPLLPVHRRAVRLFLPSTSAKWVILLLKALRRSLHLTRSLDDNHPGTT